MIDILFLAHNRLKFTRASFEALVENTNWDLVQALTVWDDGSTDGTLEYLKEASREFRRQSGKITLLHYCQKPVCSPVRVTAAYLTSPGAEFFGKLDNDVIVPPGWL